MRHVARHKSCLQILHNPLQASSPNKCIRPPHLRPLGTLSRLRILRSWPPTLPKLHIRGAKSKATLQLKDLPQGMLKTEIVAQDEEDEGPKYPTVVQQARNNMRKFENCVLLTRVGGFYELYFEHAEECAPLLNLKIAQKKTTAGPVSMAGFPFFQLDRFLKILVQDLNRYVAISEEYANNTSDKIKSGGLLFDRKVARIISPGTLIDEKFMDPYENNFLLAIHSMNQDTEVDASLDEVPTTLIKDALLPRIASMLVGLAWLDLSTGDFYTQSTTMGALSSVVARIGAKEIVLDEALSSV
ncbi:hypothetical protein MMC08_008890, partial [Hypocenomyce scalaris]|nr:hypothetical protein [Hypocenomyce scalaris]